MRLIHSSHNNNTVNKHSKNAVRQYRKGNTTNTRTPKTKNKKQSVHICGHKADELKTNTPRNFFCLAYQVLTKPQRPTNFAQHQKVISDDNNSDDDEINLRQTKSHQSIWTQA